MDETLVDTIKTHKTFPPHAQVQRQILQSDTECDTH